VHRISHKTNPTTFRFTDEDRNILNQLIELTRLDSAVDVIRLAIRESLLHRKRKADALAYEEREDATKKELRRLRIERTTLGPTEETAEDVLVPPPVPVPPPPPEVEHRKEKTLATCTAILPRTGEPCPKPAGEWMYEGAPLCDPHADAYRKNGYELRPFI
jgi:Arc/MetJ-type ribon-helix-helix transcriptional regulator